MKMKWLLLIFAVSVVLGMAVPLETTVVPAWKLQVLTENGLPVKEIFVSQSWAHYSFELGEEHIEDQWTDEDGYVTFPRRTVRASLLKRTYAPIYNFLLFREHASFGPSADVTVWWGPNKMPKSVRYESNKPLPTQIVLPQ